MKLALRIYRWLAEAFPHEFKLVYGPELTQLGEDVVEEIARQHGVIGLIRLIADIAIRVPVEYLSEMRRDLRYAIRALLKSPGFALVGIISLGLGMGVTTSVFGKLWAQMFRDIPAAANVKRLAIPQAPVSFPYIEEFRTEKALFDGVAAFQQGVPFNVAVQAGGNAKPERVFGQIVSPDYFAVLGVRAERGRLLNPALDQQGKAPVVVISDRFWRNRLGGSPDALGQTIRVNGQAATIVGITPVDFLGAIPITPAEIFVPTTAPAALAPELSNDVLHRRDAKEFEALVLLAPGVTIGSAEAALDAITRRLDAQDPSNPLREDKGRRVTLTDGGKAVPMPRAMKPVIVAFVSVLMGLILGIACMNLANMLLARGAARRKELAIRLAIGASRFRLIRQMLTEGILLASLAGVAGFGLAYWLSVLDSKLRLPSAAPTDLNYSPNWGAALFTFGLAILCGIAFSLAPALKATRADLAPTLKEGAVVQLRGHRRFGMRNLLVVGQVAGSLMLILISGFLVMGFGKSTGVEAKFDPNRMFLISIDPVRDGYSAEKAQAFFDKLPGRLRAVPGVEAVALASQAPFSIMSAPVQLATEQNSSHTKTVKAACKEAIGAGYFAALSEPLLAGREFDQRDERADDAKIQAIPVVLNQSAAQSLFGNRNVVGQRIRETSQSYEVIGVVSDLKSGIDDEDIPAATMYVPLSRREFEHPLAGGITIMVRAAAGDAGADALRGVQREIGLADPNLLVFQVQTLDNQLELSRAFLRSAVRMYGGIGLFGLILAAIGLAGVTAYAVARRRKEIGIRMALGAQKSQVLALVLREGAALVAAGSVLGFLGTVVLVRLLSALTSVFTSAFNVSTDDPRLVLGAPLLLAALAMIACYIPARRSTKIDPLVALRQE